MEQQQTREVNRGHVRCAAVVTGAAGFIGAAVCRELLSRGWRVYAVIRPGSKAERLPHGHGALQLVEGDLMQPAQWETQLETAAAAGERFDSWLQLGWEGVAGSMRNDDSQAANVEATVESVRLAARLGCSSWIGAGSQAEYGQMEGRVDEGAAETPTTAYGRAKLASGRQALEEAALHGLSGYWVRIFSVYGPGDNGSWLIPGLIRQLMAGESPAMTFGEQRWDYLYIDDAAAAFAALAEQSTAARHKQLASEMAYGGANNRVFRKPGRSFYPSHGVYNLGSGESRTIRHIAELVRQAVAARLPRSLPSDNKRVPMIRYGVVPYRDDQVMMMEADIAKLQRETGWSPQTMLTQGVGQTVDAYADVIDRDRGAAVKRAIVTMAYRSNSSHVGAALSVADLLLALYYRILRVDPQQPAAPDRDKLVFSKAHASTALYAVLAERGYLPRNVLDSYSIDGGQLPGHLDRKSAPGIDSSAGSLGHGLSIGVGFALADRLAGRDSRTYVVLGDGECNEGSVWEAALVAASLKLDHLIAVVDCNGWQGFDRTEPLSSIASLGDKWRAFGWEVDEVDGHDSNALVKALDTRSQNGRPRVVLARTVKGHGVDFMADTLEWHYKSPNTAQWKDAIAQLGGEEGKG
ncbi:transketolase N-terminal domain/subunit [Paenibacillus cellulosilyticus]|uniref:Transketolase N-terminal domain/subunit n=1 Tax=Paenibacillus cellulosilyticus TaxID=375489 RepID=A0A2V2YZK1_9BACL|nr:SDR family NAD(P)-dependent oxidoreductase [Paenibacillus cellulosilyticus]PWW06265.1 transketolase N-terminal domain/subunit [Paenibacillus cellulosilyticus]QKS42983.1 NAD-dependent epimerase/dehydratase family protein [Paenibacillus cellulosilyticus]